MYGSTTHTLDMDLEAVWRSARSMGSVVELMCRRVARTHQIPTEL